MALITISTNLNELMEFKKKKIINKENNTICFYCNVSLVNENLYCDNVKCKKSLCILCLNKLSCRQSGYFECSDLLDNVVSFDKSIDDLVSCPIMIIYNCPVCRIQNMKSLDRFPKEDILNLLSYDYNKFNDLLDKEIFIKCNKYDLLRDKRLINQQLNTALINNTKNIREIKRLQLINQNLDNYLQVEKIDNVILKVSNDIFETHLLTIESITKQHTKLKKMEIIEMLNKMLEKMKLDSVIDNKHNLISIKY